jgi:glycosyltransferase involved in cell wall biosynthesis
LKVFFAAGKQNLNAQLKILSFLPHHGSSISGGERSFFEILKRWAKWGNQIHVVTTKEGYSLLKRQGLRFFPHIYDFPETVSALSWYRCVERAIRKIPHDRFDFVYSNEPFTSVIPAFVAKNKTKAPLVVVFKALEPHESNFTSCYRSCQAHAQRTILGSAIHSTFVLLRNMLAKRADLLLIVSGYYRELLTEMDINPKRIYTIMHGVNVTHISSIKVNDGKSFDACFMGGLNPRKGIFDLVQAWKKVVDKKSDAKLVIIGTGKKVVVEQLNSLIWKLNLDKNIIQTGWLYDEKFQIMKKSKFFVFPSYAEGFALAVCEAMACGLPVVAYDLPAYKSIYKKGMIKVRTGDVQGLANAIISLLEDKNSQKNLGRDAFEQAKEYDWENSARAQLDIIARFLQIPQKR